MPVMQQARLALGGVLVFGEEALGVVGGLFPFIDRLVCFAQSRFNDDLIFCIRNGDIYYWTYGHTFSSRAVLMSSLSGAADVPRLWEIL